MHGYIYKITNKINNKFYIGQTKNTPEDRWKRHIHEATTESGRQLKTKFARAIRKYGPDAFVITILEYLEDCTAAELTDREYYWIHILDAITIGYNSNDSRCKCGGNTYFGKSETEMQIIKNKIAETKIGSRNPHSRKIKMLDTFLGQIYHFDCLQEAVKFLGVKNHDMITRRVNHRLHCLYLGRYNFAYEEDDFELLTTDPTISKSKKTIVQNQNTGELLYFKSKRTAGEFLKVSYRKIKLNTVFGIYKIIE